MDHPFNTNVEVPEDVLRKLVQDELRKQPTAQVKFSIPRSRPCYVDDLERLSDSVAKRLDRQDADLQVCQSCPIWKVLQRIARYKRRRVR